MERISEQKIERKKIFIDKKTQEKVFSVKMTWDEFALWQSWDEYPERRNDPPFMVDIQFLWNGHVYGIDYMHPKNAEQNKMKSGFYLWIDEMKPVLRKDRFIDLLTERVFNGKSFRERIEEFKFDS